MLYELFNANGTVSLFLSVSLLLPIRLTLCYLPLPQLYLEFLLSLFLNLYLGGLFLQKKKRKKYL